MKSGTGFRRCFFVLGAFLLVMSALTPGALAQTKQDVKDAEAAAAQALEEYRKVQDEYAAAVTAYEDVESQIYEVQDRIDRLQTRVAEDAATAEDLRQTARDLAVEAYVSGSMGSVNVALQARSIQDVVTSQALFERANAVSVASLDRLEAVSREMERLTASLEDDKAKLDDLKAQANAAVQRIDVVQTVAKEWADRQDDAAKAAKAAYREEQARKRAAEAARRAAEAARLARQQAAAAARAAREQAARTHVYDYLTCPVGDPHYVHNNWGDPRSGGRTHKGNDIFAPKDTKLFAVTAGTLRKRTGGLGGNAWWLYGVDGNAYYYAHLDTWANGLDTGSKVTQGQLIGYVGNTGNARGGPTHLHFEIHPDGGAAIDPYPTLSVIC